MEEHPHGRRLRFRIIAGLSILLGGIMMFSMFGCGKASYAVDYGGQKDAYRNARDTYKAGEKVRLTYSLIATDTDYSFYLDGERLDPDYEEGKGFILHFTMPDHDVQLECRAVNSMVQTPEDDGETAGELLLDFYTSTVAAADGDGYDEMVLYAYTGDQLKLVVYREDADAQSSTTFLVPHAALERCRDVIDETGMRTWNDAEPADGEEGAITVCKFRDTDGAYVRVTSEAMPEGGAQAFERIREVLQSYATDAYRA